MVGMSDGLTGEPCTGGQAESLILRQSVQDRVEGLAEDHGAVLMVPRQL